MSIMKKMLIFLIISSMIFIQGVSQAQNMSARELAQTKKEELNNTEWIISLTSTGDKRQNPEIDTITFIDGRVSSMNLENAGYSPTGFTVIVKEEAVIWETMQRDGEGNVALWQGEIKDDVMRGTLRKIDTDGRVFEFSFMSQ